MASQGDLISNKLDRQTGQFVAVITIDTSVEAPTVIYAKVVGKGIQWYPDGYDTLFLSDGKKIPNQDKKIKILNSGHKNKLAFKVVDKKLDGKSIMV
jgi:hypothetical protein